MKVERRNGSYTCRIYDRIQKRTVRLTAPTRQELLQKVNDYKTTGTQRMTIGQAIDSYIELKEKALSPSTIRGYTVQRKAFSDFENIPIASLNPINTQELVNYWIRNGASPKTIKNRFSLLKSACKIYDIPVTATLPQAVKPQLIAPTQEDVQKLLDYYRGKPMECILLLAIYGPLRRGEICALTWGDIRGNKIRVNKTIITDKKGERKVKNAPKTYAGFREVEFAPEIIAKIKSLPHDRDRIFSYNPKVLSDKFYKIVRKLGLPPMRFHDLRHFSASYFHSIGVPDKYIIKRGGWESESIMRRVYQDTIDEKEKEVTELINNNLFVS